MSKQGIAFDNPVRNVLVVCTGNICRSPMAEYYLGDCLEKGGAQGRVTVTSVGTNALVDYSAAQPAVETMADLGLNLASHQARQLEIEGIEEADLILTMEEYHRLEVISLVPEAAEKTYCLKAYPKHASFMGVPDPYGLSRKAYARAFRQMRKQLDLICKDILDSLSSVRDCQLNVGID
ncbi:MAG: low molecular weight protein arginine phosphatase [bacterium]